MKLRNHSQALHKLQSYPEARTDNRTPSQRNYFQVCVIPQAPSSIDSRALLGAIGDILIASGYPVQQLPRTILIAREANEIDQAETRAGSAEAEGRNGGEWGGVG